MPEELSKILEEGEERDLPPSCLSSVSRCMARLFPCATYQGYEPGEREREGRTDQQLSYTTSSPLPNPP